MTTRATLLDLAARCEATTGPDRELDRRIDHVRWPVAQPAYHLELSLRDRWDVPAFTASLDAAATLVPEGHAWAVYGGDRQEGHATAYCVPNAGRLPWPKWVDDVTAATPALALTAAALRVRAEGMRE